MRRRLFLLTLAAALVTGTARAGELTLAIHDVTLVQDGRGAARILFGVDALSTSDRVHVERAILTVPYSGSVSERTLELRVCPLSNPYQGGGNWDTPFEADLYARTEWDLRNEAGTLRFDLSQIVRARRAEGVPVAGFVLTLGNGLEDHLTAADVARFSSLQGASLIVTTRNLPSGLPPQAYRERHNG